VKYETIFFKAILSETWQEGSDYLFMLEFPERPVVPAFCHENDWVTVFIGRF
jgi:hypothetical protein